MPYPSTPYWLGPSPQGALAGNVDALPLGFEYAKKEPFVYNVTIPALGVGTATGTTEVGGSAYFACVGLNCQIWDAATQFTTQRFVVQFPGFIAISDTSSGRQLMSATVPFAAFFEFLQMTVFPYRCQLYLPGSQITATITSLQAGPWTFTVSFIGFKIFAQLPDIPDGPLNPVNLAQPRKRRP